MTELSTAPPLMTIIKACAIGVPLRASRDEMHNEEVLVASTLVAL